MIGWVNTQDGPTKTIWLFPEAQTIQPVNSVSNAMIAVKAELSVMQTAINGLSIFKSANVITNSLFESSSTVVDILLLTLKSRLSLPRDILKI
jgi:hypothetical protein